MLSTERIKWQITCPNKAAMKATNKDYAYYRQVFAECLINQYHNVYTSFVTNEFSQGIEQAKAKLLRNRWMKWNSPVGNDMKLKIILREQKQEKRRWQIIIAIVISIANVGNQTTCHQGGCGLGK